MAPRYSVMRPRFLGSSTHRSIEVEQTRPKQGDTHTLFLIGGAEFSKMWKMMMDFAAFCS